MNKQFNGKRGLIKLQPYTNADDLEDPQPITFPNMNFDLASHEMKSTLNKSSHRTTRDNKSGMSSSWGKDDDTDNFSLISAAETVNTLNSEAMRALNFHERTDKLFSQFCKALQMRTNEMEVFDIILQLHRLCGSILADNVSVVERFSEKRAKTETETSEWLHHEMKTWKLIHDLYHDRKVIQAADEDSDEILELGNMSEKRLVARLYASNANIREYQLVVDWLESSHTNRDRAAMVSQLVGKNVGWENTLLLLKGQKDVAFCGTGDIVFSVDPDAPGRENRNLHPLDAQDDLLLSRCVFLDVRSGKFDEALTLLQTCGQASKAALLMGWQLFDDPNHYDENTNPNEKLPTEGNMFRDMWKKAAWGSAGYEKFNQYYRATLGALCGRLDSLKLVLNTWEDLLWAHLKVQIDIRVETEIRSGIVKRFVTMPEDYWNQKMALEKIFEELTAHPEANVSSYANSYIGVIQKYIILDDSVELLNKISSWIEGSSSENSKTKLTPHHLRFFTHIVLFLKQIGGIDNEEQAESVISAYVEYLIEKGNAHLVAFYSAGLRPKIHVELYAKFLENIFETTERSNALEEAINMGLDAELILKSTVENVRKREPNEEEKQKMQAGDISQFDEVKISSLEWLTFIPSQRVELFWQSNAMIRYYLGENKTDCVKAVLERIPKEAMNEIVDLFGGKQSLPFIERISVKEHLCYTVYIAALDAFNDWCDLNQNRPKEPNASGDNDKYAERVASEHKEMLYQKDFSRWSKVFDEQSTVTLDALYNILVFPEGGWLVDPEPLEISGNISGLDLENRAKQMENIRSIVIPEITLFIHELLSTRKDHKACMKLADEIAAEERQLYKAFSKDKLNELLNKIASSSMALLNLGLDPWGFPKTV